MGGGGWNGVGGGDGGVVGSRGEWVVVMVVEVGDNPAYSGYALQFSEKPIPRVSWKLPPLLRHYSAAEDKSPEPQREDITYKGGRAISSSRAVKMQGWGRVRTA